MEIVQLTYPHQLTQSDISDTVVAVGYFDGVHLGHQKVIKRAKAIADEKGMISAVMTFHPHPSVVLKKKKQHIRYITPIEEKASILESLGIDRMYVVTFNDELADLLPQQFVDHFFIKINVKHVVAGFDFTYGRMGKGSMETLPFHSRGAFTQTVINKVEKERDKISSTLIREFIDQGKIAEVSELLGRPYQLCGRVISGDKRGRTIGFPTANLNIERPFLLPRVGVYAVGLKLEGQYYLGMANVGYKPTFYDNTEKISIEIHIFDYNNSIYGQELCVDWFEFIRDEVKFNGIEELVCQLKDDENQIRRFFSGLNLTNTCNLL